MSVCVRFSRWALCVAGLACATPVVAAPYSIFGRLSGGSVVDDDVRSLDVELRDSADVVIAEFAVEDVALIAGGFAFDIDATFDAAIDVAAALGPVDVRVSFVDDDGAAVAASAQLGATAVATFATEADASAQAGIADTLGALTIDDVFSASRLASTATGVIPIAFSALTAVPNGIADGVDNGNVDTVGTGLSLTGNALDVAAASVTSAALVDGSVTTAAIADGAIDGNILGGVSGANFVDNSLTAAEFAPAGIAQTNVSGAFNNVFQNPLGCDTAQGFFVSAVLSSSCTKRTGCSAGQVRNCATGLCETGAATTCSRVRLGALLFAP